VIHASWKNRRANATVDIQRHAQQSFPVKEVGEERTFTGVAALVDTNILVYRFDSGFGNNHSRKQIDALREAEEFLKQFTVLYPNETSLRHTIRGCAAYQLNWFNAHLWSYAEYYGLLKSSQRNLQHDRLYSTVGIVSPFVDLP
jgi:hypothetical protein